MSQTRLTDLAVLSIERELADGLNFDSVINNFAERKARKVCLYIFKRLDALWQFFDADCIMCTITVIR